METAPSVPRAILVGVQLPNVDDMTHAASLEELGRLVKTLGYEVVGTMSQKRDEIAGGTVLGKGRLEALAAMTGGLGVVGSMAPLRKSKARERPHERRLPCVRVPDQRDPELIATSGSTLVVVSMDILQLHFQFREAIADLATIDLEIGLAGAGPLPPAAARRRFPQAR